MDFPPINVPGNGQLHARLVTTLGEIVVRLEEQRTPNTVKNFVGLANPKGRWITGSLQTIGAAPDNTSSFLGQEVDATIRVTPWDPISFQLGYGLFLTGDGGKAILTASGRTTTTTDADGKTTSVAPDMQHWGYLQVVVKAP